MRRSLCANGWLVDAGRGKDMLFWEKESRELR